MDPISQFVVTHVLTGASHGILPLMVIAFFCGVTARWLIYYYARAEYQFAMEFQKRAVQYSVDQATPRIGSFNQLVKALMETTYYETFELRRRYKRRNLDYITSFTDRLLMIDEGVERLVRDSIERTRYLRRESGTPPMVEVTKGIVESNPFFNRLLGIFNMATVHELLNILPGLFIIGGIFGTFLGIAKGIPELGGLDMGQVEESKKVMDGFLVTISQAMVKSIVGIGLSVLMSLINTIFAPENLHYQMVNRFTETFGRIWYETTTNVGAAPAQKTSQPLHMVHPAPIPQPTVGRTASQDLSHGQGQSRTDMPAPIRLQRGK